MRLLEQLKERSWPTAPLRTYLIAVILLATLPMAALMIFQIFADVREEQAEMQTELAATASALSQAVDRELLSSFDALAVLSQSDVLQRGQIARLGDLLQWRPRRDWGSIFVLDRDGAALLDTSSPVGESAQAGQLRELHRRVLAKSQPDASTLTDAAGGGRRMIAVAVPVVQGGTVRYVIGARIAEAAWQQLVSAANAPAGARTSLLDAQGRVIGDSAGPVAAGLALPPDAAAAMRERPSGLQRSSDFDSRTVYAAWHVVPSAGWQVRVALPAAPIDAAHRKAMIAALTASGACLLLGLLLAARQHAG